MLESQELPQFQQHPEEATALNCSKCGAPALRGAPMCRHCGSGLNSEVLLNIDLLRSQITELDWKSELGGQRLDDAIVSAIKIAKERSEDVFFLFKGIPAVVKLGMDAEQIVENWHRVSTIKDRDSMGDRWYKALAKFHKLQERMGKMDPDNRQRVSEHLYGGPDWSDRRKPDLSFFTAVSFPVLICFTFSWRVWVLFFISDSVKFYLFTF